MNALHHKNLFGFVLIMVFTLFSVPAFADPCNPGDPDYNQCICDGGDPCDCGEGDPFMKGKYAGWGDLNCEFFNVGAPNNLILAIWLFGTGRSTCELQAWGDSIANACFADRLRCNLPNLGDDPCDVETKSCGL